MTTTTISGGTMSEYQGRYQAINDALWLVQRGPRDPRPPVEDRQGRGLGAFEPLYASTSYQGPADDPRYAEISLALDIARFLLDEELDDDEEPAA